MDIIGIDISKGWFDCFNYQQADRKRFANTPAGWKRLGQWAPRQSWIIMEASGPYYLGLASWLDQQGVSVSVVNPLVIRRYGQMKLNRTKTDAKDAELIAGYGVEQKPRLWSPPTRVCLQMRQLMSLREGLLRQRGILRGQQEAFSQSPVAEELTRQILAEQIGQIERQLNRIDQRLQQLATTHYAEQMQALQTIPGIGPKTAIMLLVLTDGFIRFQSARQLASYVGICPRVWQSGSSIQGRGAICKLGAAHMRKLLYMCSWTAKLCNPACRSLYDRMAAKGKPERVIKVAIAHKLLRQAFAVGKKQQSFDEKIAMAA